MAEFSEHPPASGLEAEPPAIDRALVARELRGLLNEWEDHPENHLLETDYADPKEFVRKKKNKRRAGAWFGPVVGWVELVSPYLPDTVQAKSLATRAEQLRTRVEKENLTKHAVTDEDVREGDALIRDTLEAMDEPLETPNA